MRANFKSGYDRTHWDTVNWLSDYSAATTCALEEGKIWPRSDLSELWAKSQYEPGTVLSRIWCHVQDTVIGGKRRDAVFGDWSTLWCFYYSKLDRSQIIVWITGCIWFIAESEN